MTAKKLLLVNVPLVAVLVIAGVSAWNISRNIAPNEMTFRATNEVVVYSEKAMAKAEALPIQKIILVPMPIVAPKVLFQVLPEFPRSVKDGGALVVKALVSSSGDVDRVEVKSSSGNGSLDRSAVSAISKWKFSPARRGAAAVASWFTVPVRFETK